MTSLRKATEDDLPIIRSIAEATWPVAYGAILSPSQLSYMLSTLFSDERLSRDMVESKQTFLILNESGTPFGFAAYGPWDQAARVVKLHKLYILPSAQGRGYGIQLLHAVIEHSCREHFTKLILNVNRHNKAKGFYERIGFCVEREEDIPIGEYWMNDYVMSLALPEVDRE